MSRSDPGFPHVEGSRADPVDTSPAEAIQAVVERGVLSDWRRLVEASQADPWGRVARIVEEVTVRGEHYGVDPLLQRVVARARGDAGRTR